MRVAFAAAAEWKTAVSGLRTATDISHLFLWRHEVLTSGSECVVTVVFFCEFSGRIAYRFAAAVDSSSSNSRPSSVVGWALSDVKRLRLWFCVHDLNRGFFKFMNRRVLLEMLRCVLTDSREFIL